MSNGGGPRRLPCYVCGAPRGATGGRDLPIMGLVRGIKRPLCRSCKADRCRIVINHDQEVPPL